LGSIDRDLVFRVLEAVQAKDAAALMQLVSNMAEQSIDFSGAVSEVISVLHRLAVAQAVPDAIDNAEGDRDRLLQLAQQLSPEDVQLFYQMALHGRRDLPLAVDARAGFEMTLLRMMLFRPLATTDVINHAAGVNATEKKPLAPAPQVSATPAPVLQAPVVEPTPEPVVAPVVELAPEPAPAPVPVAPVQSSSGWTPESWAEWVDASGLTGGALNLARHALMQVSDQGQWQLCLSPKHQMLAAGQALTQLQTQFQAQYPQHRFDLVMQEPSGETPASRRQRLRAERLAQAESAVLADPVVKAVMTTFNAQIVPDSLVMND
jgi:DNA polymerase-3 subunit gamma/tau